MVLGTDTGADPASASDETATRTARPSAPTSSAAARTRPSAEPVVPVVERSAAPRVPTRPAAADPGPRAQKTSGPKDTSPAKAKGKGKGKPQPDAALRDTENVPLSEDIRAYFAREVLPHAPDAWIDEDKTRVGYEIPFNRHFYVFEPPRALEEIDADLKGVTDRIRAMIEELAA